MRANDTKGQIGRELGEKPNSFVGVKQKSKKPCKIRFIASKNQNLNKGNQAEEEEEANTKWISKYTERI